MNIAVTEKRVSEFVYQGRRFVNGKLLYQYRELNDDENIVLVKGTILDCAIGSIIEAEQDESTILAINYLRATDSDVTHWFVADEMAMKEYRTNQNMKKLPATRYNTLVSEIRDIAKGLPANQKSLFYSKLMMDVMKD